MTRNCYRPLARTLVSVSVVCLSVLHGCAPKANNGGSKQASDSQSLVTPPQLGTAPAASSTTSNQNSTGPRRPSVQDTSIVGRAKGNIPPNVPREGGSKSTFTVSSFLKSRIGAGERVRISGTCLDQFHTRASAGSPPVNRSDWQLSTGDDLLYVVGRMPPSCAGGQTTIAGMVSVDTALIAGERRARRYLSITR
jgi:hypothetical protein